MTMINAIVMENFKGTNSTQQLSGLDVFIGPNGVGKSTRLQALQTAMLGYVPGNGKTEPGTFNKFSSDARSMGAGLQLEGFAFVRSFERTTKAGKHGPDVKVSQSLWVSPSRMEKTETEKKGRVAAEVGSFAVMLDFSEFTGLTDNKRRDFIYSLSGAGQSDAWNKTKIEEYLTEKLLTMELEVADPDLYNMLSESIQAALSKFDDGMTIDEALEAIRSFVKNELSVWKRKAADAEGTTRQLTEQKNKLGATDRDIRANKEELVRMRSQFIEIETQIARDTEKKKAIDKRMSRLAELDAMIAKLQNTPVPDTTGIDAEIDQLQTQMDHTSDQQEYDALSAQKATCQEQLDSIRDTIASLQQEETKLSIQVVNIQRTLDTIDQNIGFCVIQRSIKCEQDFSAYVDRSIQEISELNDKRAEISTTMTEAREAGRTLVDKINSLEQQMSDIMKRAQTRQQENEKRSRRIQELNNKKAAVNAAEQKRLDDLGRAQVEREELQNQPVEAIAPIDLLNSRRDGLREEIDTLTAKLEEQEKARNNMQQIRAALLSNKEAEHKAKAFKLIDDALGPKGIQGEIVKSMLEPMRADIEHNLWHLGVQRTVFFQTESDTGQEIFQFGWEHNGQRRNYDALSTGQQLMFLIAFLVAVIERANPPVKVLAIDNIEHLDHNNQRAILEGLHSMQHRLDNIILAGVIAPDIAQETGWMVHELQRDEETLEEQVPMVMAAAGEEGVRDELGF